MKHHRLRCRNPLRCKSFRVVDFISPAVTKRFARHANLPPPATGNQSNQLSDRMSHTVTRRGAVTKRLRPIRAFTMNKNILLLLGVSLLPSIVVIAFPRFSLLGPLLMFAGFLVLIVSSLASSFKRHKYGPFAQWIEPTKYCSMQFTDPELWFFKLSGCIALGGILAVGALLLKPT